MTTTACTVIVSANGSRCGAEAVSVRESYFGGTIAECAAHHVATTAPTDIDVPVEIQWHTWAKRGVVVGESASSLKVQFVPRAGAEAIVRSFPRDRVRFL